MDDYVTDGESDADIAEKMCDGLEVMAAFCSIDSSEMRRSVKRIVFALSGPAESASKWARLKAYAELFAEDSVAARRATHNLD